MRQHSWFANIGSAYDPPPSPPFCFSLLYFIFLTLAPHTVETDVEVQRPPIDVRTPLVSLDWPIRFLFVPFVQHGFSPEEQAGCTPFVASLFTFVLSQPWAAFVLFSVFELINCSLFVPCDVGRPQLVSDPLERSAM